jgi:hypothetical protein
MNLLKVAGVVIVGIILFIVLGHAISFILSAITAIFFIALVAGGGYIAYKLVGGGRRREIR